MRRLLIIMCIIAMPCISFADILVDQLPADGLQFGNGLSGKVSGYNNGSIMNEGRHFAQADDFLLSGDQAWQIDSISFVCGVQLAADPHTIRVSVYEGETAPSAYGSHIWQYEESTSAADGNFEIASQLIDSGTDTYELAINLDLSEIALVLNSQTQYYLSIEADCLNTQDIHLGYDTYYQRFYWANNGVAGQSFGTEQNGGVWQDWQSNNEEFAWAMEGHEVPEPISLSLLVAGGLLLRKRKVCN